MLRGVFHRTGNMKQTPKMAHLCVLGSITVKILCSVKIQPSLNFTPLLVDPLVILHKCSTCMQHTSFHLSSLQFPPHISLLWNHFVSANFCVKMYVSIFIHDACCNGRYRERVSHEGGSIQTGVKF